MADIKAYWAKVVAIKAQLPPGQPVWLVSMDNDHKGTHSGAVVQCSTDLAAQRIADRTHRVATQEEVDVNSAMVADRKKRSDAQEARRRASNSSTLVLSPDHLAQLGLAGMPAPTAPAKGKKVEETVAT
jgi:hypothetical protein